MSSQARKDEKRREWDAEQERMEYERRRKASLTFYERVIESYLSEELQEFLTEIYERLERLEGKA